MAWVQNPDLLDRQIYKMPDDYFIVPDDCVLVPDDCVFSARRLVLSSDDYSNNRTQCVKNPELVFFLVKIENDISRVL